MKIEKKQQEFQPIVITLESEQEQSALLKVIDQGLEFNYLIGKECLDHWDSKLLQELIPLLRGT